MHFSVVLDDQKVPLPVNKNPSCKAESAGPPTAMSQHEPVQWYLQGFPKTNAKFNQEEWRKEGYQLKKSGTAALNHVAIFYLLAFWVHFFGIDPVLTGTHSFSSQHLFLHHKMQPKQSHRKDSLGSLTPQSSSLFFLFIGKVAVGKRIHTTVVGDWWNVWFLVNISVTFAFSFPSDMLSICHMALACCSLSNHSWRKWCDHKSQLHQLHQTSVKSPRGTW